MNYIFGGLIFGALFYFLSGKVEKKQQEKKEKETAQNIQDNDVQLTKLIKGLIPDVYLWKASDYIPTPGIPGIDKASSTQSMEILKLLVRIKNMRKFAGIFYDSYKRDISDALRNYLPDAMYIIASKIMGTDDSKRAGWVKVYPNLA